eukprot:3489559-Pyramimonas_sp.AAC.1
MENLLSLCQSHQLAVIHTEWNAGDTYFGATSDPKTLDYIIAPREFADHVSWCRTFQNSAWRFQSHHHSKLWNHVPLACKIPYEYAQSQYYQPDRIRFSGEALSMMVQRGWKRAEFLQSVEPRLSEQWDYVRNLPSAEAMDKANEILMTTLNDCAQPLFSESPLYTEDHERHSEEVSRLLLQRRGLRGASA